MIKLIYDETGMPHSDFGLQEYVNHLCEIHNEPLTVVKTSTENMVLAFRVAIYLGKLHHEDFIFVDQDQQEMKFNKNATPIKRWYKETFFDKSLNTLIGL